MVCQKNLAQKWLKNCNPLTNCFNFTDYEFVSKECLIEKIISRIFWWNILKKNPPNKLQVRWKVTMPFRAVRKRCGITANNQIWIPYLPNVRRKKIMGCGWGPRPSPRTVLQLVVFTYWMRFYSGANISATSCGIFTYR